jgi:citronellol/citronellal dehydrogenase
VWFEHTSCYSVSKYALSLYTLGWAREFAADGIAANCLWPRTGIESPAALVHGGPDLLGEFRSARIMADAAHAILSQPTSYTGQFCIDDSTLAELTGMKNFDAYSVQAGAALVPDYFIPADRPAPAGVQLSRFRLYDLGVDHPPMG